MNVKVLYIDSGLTGGGSVQSLYQYISNCRNDSVNSCLVCFNDTPILKKFIQLGVKVVVLRNLFFNQNLKFRHPSCFKQIERFAIFPSLTCAPVSVGFESFIHRKSIRAITDIIENEKIDLVHTNNQPNRDLYAIIAARRAGVPCVSHLRSFFSFGFNAAKARFVNKAVSRFVAYSPAVAEHWTAQGLNEAKVEVVFNAVGKVEAKPRNLHTEFEIPADASVIGAVGKIIPERGYEFLIRSFARASSNNSSIYLLIVGGGDSAHMRDLQDLVMRLGVEKRIFFAGHRDQAIDYIAAMDALVLPYSIEPFGRVLLEAWALGVPAVVTDVGGIRSIVQDEKDALVVPFGDEKALAGSLQKLAEDKTFAEALGESGRKTVTQRFDIDRYVSEMERIYAEVLESTPQ